MTRPSRAPSGRADSRAVNCISYARVSTTDQAAEDKTSIADQRKATEALAAKLGRQIAQPFKDEGVSGAKDRDRPGFMAMVRYCQANPCSDGVVLVLNATRFGRFENPDRAGYWRTVLEDAGWKIRYVENDDSSANPSQRHLLRAFGDAQASEYRLTLKRNTRAGMKGTADRGFWSRPEPYGYRRKVVIGRERVLQPRERKADGERVALVPDEQEAATVRLFFTTYARGEHSIRSLCRWAKEHAPERVWSVRAVGLVLGNPTYCGDVVSRHRCSDPEGYGKTDAHPAIVSRELFAQVQARLKLNRDQPRAPKSPWILSGLVTCELCGEPYTAGGLGSRQKDGTKTRFYADRGGRDDMKGGKRCKGTMGTVSKRLLDDAVLGTIADELSRPAMARRLQAAIDRHFHSAGDSTAAALAKVRQDLARLEKRRDNLIAAVADGTIERHEAAPQLATVRGQIEQAREQVQRGSFSRRQIEAGKGERHALLAMASNFAESVKSLPPVEVRELVRPWLASATFDKRTRQLTLAIRRVPAVPGLILTHSPGQVIQDQDLIVRRVQVGGRR